jgi:hypothetical protein
MTQREYNREEPFESCLLPLKAYQRASFQLQPDQESYEPYYDSPIYLVEFTAAMRTPFEVERCLMLVDAPSANKLAIAMHAIGSGTDKRIHALERMMADEPYGRFER